VVAEHACAPAHGDFQDGVGIEAGLRGLAQEVGERRGPALARQGVAWGGDRRQDTIGIGGPVGSLERR
jgi:hypothetical protein